MNPLRLHYEEPGSRETRGIAGPTAGSSRPAGPMDASLPEGHTPSSPQPEWQDDEQVQASPKLLKLE